MYDLTAFQRDILMVIAGHDEPHGLAVKDTLDEYYDEDINHGRLYPNLDTLVNKGLIEKGAKDRRTNKYAITRRGREAIVARREFEEEQIGEFLEEEASVV